MTVSNYTEIDELVVMERAVAKMRELGVTRMKSARLELELGPPPAPREEPSPAETNPRLRKVGRDGLTLVQQIDLYGRVIDSPED